MIIDFHTHIFPEKIASGAIRQLEEVGGVQANTNGTLQGLKESMQKSGITYSLVLPVVTKPSQFQSVNSYAAEINGKDGILSFGGIHPLTENYKEELNEIKTLGLKGIKLHPDYQRTYVDDESIIRILDYAAELGLIVLFHAGVDIGLPDPVHCTPLKAAKVLDKIDYHKIVLAHTGGYQMWDEVERYLVGRNVYFDISFSLGQLPDEQFLRIVRSHGSDRILFASDSPWGGQEETLKRLLHFDLTEKERSKILYKNASKLLKLE